MTTGQVAMTTGQVATATGQVATTTGQVATATDILLNILMWLFCRLFQPDSSVPDRRGIPVQL